MDDAGYPAVRALIRMEMRRMMPFLGRSLSMAGVIMAALFVTGAITPGRVAFLLAVIGGAVVMAFPLNTVRDKLDGGMEFLCFLPVTPQAHALARLISLVVVAVPGAIICTGAVAFSLHDSVPSVVNARSLIGVAVGLELALVGGGYLTGALFLRFDVSSSSLVPVGVIFGLYAFGALVDRWVPDPMATVTRLASHSWFLPSVWWGGTLAVAALAWLAFLVTASGIARFTPPKDRMTW